MTSCDAMGWDAIWRESAHSHRALLIFAILLRRWRQYVSTVSRVRWYSIVLLCAFLLIWLGLRGVATLFLVQSSWLEGNEGVQETARAAATTNHIQTRLGLYYCTCTALYYLYWIIDSNILVLPRVSIPPQHPQHPHIPSTRNPSLDSLTIASTILWTASSPSLEKEHFFISISPMSCLVLSSSQWSRHDW